MKYFSDLFVGSLDEGVEHERGEGEACDTQNYTLGRRRSRAMPDVDYPTPPIEEGLSLKERMAPGFND